MRFFDGRIARAWASLVALAAIFAIARPASAQMAPCQAANQGWVRDASIAIGVGLSVVECSTARYRMRLSPPGAEPMDIDLSRDADEAFRRIGDLSLSPIMNGEWQEVPEVKRRAFDGLSSWISDHADRVSFEPAAGLPPPARAAPVAGKRWRVPWLAVTLALSVSALALSLYRSSARLYGLIAGALCVFSAGIRCALGAWGPFHFNGQGALWVLGAAGAPHEISSYGPGFVELYSPIVDLFAADPERAVFTTNLIVSATIPAVAMIAARLVGFSRRRSLLVGLVAVLDPVSILMAPTESYFNPTIALSILGAALGLVAIEAWDSRRRVVATTAAVAMACALTESARVHPVAWLPAMLACLAPLASRRPLSPLRRIEATSVLGLGTAALAFFSSGAALRAVWANFESFSSPTYGVDACVRVAPALAATLALLLWRSSNRWLVVVGAVTLMGYVFMQHTNWEIWQECMLRLYLLFPFLAVLSAIPRKAALGERADALLAVGLLLAVAIAGARVLRGRSAEQEEAAWLRPWASSLPRGCSVAYASRAGTAVLYLPIYRRPGEASDPALRVDLRYPVDPAAIRPQDCVYYVRGSLCARREAVDACRSLESKLTLEPVRSATFVPGPNDDRLDYAVSPVETTVFRVTGIR